jgi:hypothetical protein
MNTDESGYSQAELRFCLPLAPGQRVGAPGDSPRLIEALAADGLEIVIVSVMHTKIAKDHEVGTETIPDLDHLIIPEYPCARDDPALACLLGRLAAARLPQCRKPVPRLCQEEEFPPVLPFHGRLPRPAGQERPPGRALLRRV